MNAGYAVGVAGLVCFLPLMRARPNTRLGTLETYEVLNISESTRNVVLTAPGRGFGGFGNGPRGGGGGGGSGGRSFESAPMPRAPPQMLPDGALPD